MDESLSRRRRRTATQPYEAPTPTHASPRSTRNTSSSAAAMTDDSPYLSPSGRPMRQRPSVNARTVTPPAVPSSTRPSRASSSRIPARDESSPFQEDEDEEEEYVEEEAEEEIMPSRNRRSSTRARQQPSQPAAPAASSVSHQRENSASSHLRVNLSTRSRGVTSRTQKRVRLAEEQDAGWMPEIDDDDEMQLIYSTIIAKMQSWLSDKSIGLLSDFFEKTPNGTKFEKPMTLTTISEKVAKSEYASTIDFEKDMLQLFYNGRRYFLQASEEYGGLVTLQRMYQNMTQSSEAAKEDFSDDAIQNNYASLRFGPCEDEGEGQGEAPSTGDKVVVPYLRYKGQTISVGNFVHLSNPTDPSRPIIAQIFKTRTESIGNEASQDWVTACWFLRPEQTKHPRSMVFWPDEALKTSQLVEHHVEDILEMICVMYYTKYMKGRPAEGEGGWREGDPLYVCENRFHAEKELFYKIKNWSGVMPEEVRNKRFDIIEFDQPMAQPMKVKSPFLLGSNGPGGIAEEGLRPPISAPSLIRSNSSFMGSGSGVSSPMGAGSGALGSIPRAPSRVLPPTTNVAASGATTTTTKIPQLFKEWSEDVRVQRKAYLKAKEERAAMEGPVSGADQTTTLPGAAPSSTTPSQQMPPIAHAIDRSVSNAMIQMDVPAYYKTLPSETQQLFHQDAESGNVLWYPAPPFLAPSEIKTQRQWNHGDKMSVHSLDYLYYLATGESKKRKNRS